MMAEAVGGGEPVAHRTRGALEELPRAASISLRYSPGGNVDNTLPWSATINLPSSYLSPSPSPDELVIRGRGRRSLPLEWSPIPIESPIKRTEKTPVKRLPGKGSLIVLRSSPRKRLQLNETPPSEIMEGRRKLMQISPLLKKCRSLTVSPSQSPPEVAIKGEISDILPQPDLKAMEEKLNLQKKCIFKSLPVSRLASKTDSPAYNRASPHLSNFKKTLMEQCSQLSEAEQWMSLVDYTLLAWSYVRATPNWDSSQHNNIRKICFKILAQHCLQGLKEVSWNQDQLENLLKKLEQCRADHEEVQQCIEHVRTAMSNQP